MNRENKHSNRSRAWRWLLIGLSIASAYLTGTRLNATAATLKFADGTQGSWKTASPGGTAGNDGGWRVAA